MTLREKIKRVRIIRTEPDKIIKSKLLCKNQICWRVLWIMSVRIIHFFALQITI